MLGRLGAEGESSGGGRHCGMAGVRGKNVPDASLARSPPLSRLFNSVQLLVALG